MFPKFWNCKLLLLLSLLLFFYPGQADAFQPPPPKKACDAGAWQKYYDQGKVIFKSNANKARGLFQKALKIAMEENASYRDQAKILIALGDCSNKWERGSGLAVKEGSAPPQRAEVYAVYQYYKAISLYDSKDIAPDAQLAGAHYRLAMLLYDFPSIGELANKQDIYSEARFQFNKAIEILTKVEPGNENIPAWYRTFANRAESTEENIDRAESLLTRAKNHIEKAGTKDQYWKTSINLALLELLYVDKLDYQKYKPLVRVLINTTKHGRNLRPIQTVVLADCAQDVGEYLLMQDKADKAILYLKAAKTLRINLISYSKKKGANSHDFRPESDLDLARTETTLGRAYIASDNKKEARIELENAYKKLQNKLPFYDWRMARLVYAMDTLGGTSLAKDDANKVYSIYSKESLKKNYGWEIPVASAERCERFMYNCEPAKMFDLCLVLVKKYYKNRGELKNDPSLIAAYLPIARYHLREGVHTPQNKTLGLSLLSDTSASLMQKEPPQTKIASQIIDSLRTKHSGSLNKNLDALKAKLTSKN